MHTCPCGCGLKLLTIPPGKNRWLKQPLLAAVLTREFLWSHRDFGQRWIAQTVGCKLDVVSRAVDRAGLRRSDFPSVKTSLIRTFRVTAQARTLIDGLLLGDASLRDGKINTQLRQSSVSRVWRDELRASLLKIGVETTGSTDRRPNKNDGFVYGSRSYVTFRRDFYPRWYKPDGGRRVPDDLELNFGVLRLWVLSDGTRRGAGLELCSERFPPAEQVKLVNGLVRLGLVAALHPYRSKHRIKLSAEAWRSVRRRLVLPNDAYFEWRFRK